MTNYTFRLFDADGHLLITHRYTARTDLEAFQRWCRAADVQDLSNQQPYKLIIESTPAQ